MTYGGQGTRGQLCSSTAARGRMKTGTATRLIVVNRRGLPHMMTRDLPSTRPRGIRPAHWANLL